MNISAIGDIAIKSIHAPRGFDFMKECAFCSETANLSLEHLWSDWMNDLFPGKKRFTRKNEKGEIISDYIAPSLNWKARVVCEKCNNTWMSQIEQHHAKPAMADLITGAVEVDFSSSRARSLAIFGFKTAVVFDHVSRKRQPFFDRAARHQFAKSLIIPRNVAMWMAGFLPIGKGEVHSCYHDGEFNNRRLEMYVCTYAVGHLTLQIIAAKDGNWTIAPTPGFEYLAIPFWPTLPKRIIWPAASVLRTVADFDAFSRRWEVVEIIS